MVETFAPRTFADRAFSTTGRLPAVFSPPMKSVGVRIDWASARL
jgi:hypothetical protein